MRAVKNVKVLVIIISCTICENNFSSVHLGEFQQGVFYFSSFNVII